MLLHAEGWCLVHFFKPADWIYRVHEKGGGARLLGAVRLGIIRYISIFQNVIYKAQILSLNKIGHIKTMFFYFIT